MAKNTNKKKHLGKAERFCIEKMLKVEDSLGHIARTLGRGLSTISEEVSGNGGKEKYNAEKAHHCAYLKQYWKKKNCNKVAMNGHLTRFVERKLEKGWSPERISCRLKKQSGIGQASSKSIRKFIKRRSGLERFLFWHRNDKKSGPKSNKIFLSDPLRKSIDLRPIEALLDYGHWEMDFIVSKCNSFVLLVLVEKFSKIVRLKILPNRNKDLVNETIVSLLKGSLVKTITTDNDIAFGKWEELEKMLNAEIYFCYPYHSWEKGLVENTNRWIREFVPKRSDIKEYSKEYIQWIEDWFNHIPRECLDGSTSYEIMFEKEYGKIVESLEINLPRLRIWG